MFDVLPKALASVASFLFPLFASYKALNTSDPAQLTPWLMYWVVLACVLLVESWTDWLLVWIPFYHYFRLFFLLYLVLPQTQGARVLYQTHLHPWLTQHEARIDEFIGSAHNRMRSAGMHYLKQAIAYLRTALGLPAQDIANDAYGSTSTSAQANSPQSYTQSLLARFTLPSARWPGGAMGSAAAAAAASSSSADPSIPSTGADFYNLLASAVGALGTATGAAGGVAAGAAASALSRGINSAAAGISTGSSSNNNSDRNNMTASGTLIPADVPNAERATFLAIQRDRLRTLLSALERETAQLEVEDETLSKTSPLSRPLSSASGLSKSRSEADFEKIDAESGAEDDKPLRQRRHGGAATGAQGGKGASGDAAHPGADNRSASGSWMPWGWGSGGGGGAGEAANPDGNPAENEAGKSSSVEQ